MVWSRASRFKQLNDVGRIIGHMKLLERVLNRHNACISTTAEKLFQRSTKAMSA